MMAKVFEITFTPVAISIICGILITVNHAVPIVPIWPIWGMLIISTIVAFGVIGLCWQLGLCSGLHSG